MTNFVSPLKERLTASKEGLLLWHQERSILEVTELVCEVMEKSGVSRTELADRLEKSKGHVSQLLDGSKNMTIRTISDLFTVLGYEFHPRAVPIESEHRRRYTVEVATEPRDDTDWEWPGEISLTGYSCKPTFALAH